MKAGVCVDYLSHDWSPSDLIHTQRETRCQISQLNTTLISCSSTEDKVRIELQRLARFQNALWRQMARTCTSNLGRHNRMIHPSSVNWQKESDITWLYGPLYTLDQPASPPSSCSSQHSGLKPVLKKTIKLPSHEFVLPTLSDQSFEQAHYRPWSKTTSESGTSSTSSSISASHGVRFSHNIMQVEYLPESPVRESFGDQNQGPLDMAYYDSECDSDPSEDEEALEDGILWSLVADTGVLVQHCAETCLARLARYFVQPHTRSVTPTHGKLATSVEELDFHHHPSTELPALLLSTAKSTASFAAAWVAYQSLQPFAWFVEPASFQSSSEKESAHWLSTLEGRQVPPPNANQLVHSDIRPPE